MYNSIYYVEVFAKLKAFFTTENPEFYTTKLQTNPSLLESYKEISKYPRLSSVLATHFFKGKRVPEWEPNICLEPSLSLKYARVNIVGPWPEAEATLFKSPHYSPNYAHIRPEQFPDEAIKNIIKGFLPTYFLDYLESGNLKSRLSPELEVDLLRGEYYSWHKDAYITFLKQISN